MRSQKMNRKGKASAAMRELEMSANLLNTIRRNRIPSCDTTCDEFVAKCKETLHLSIPLLKLECEFCHNDCSNEFLYVNSGDNYFAHEACWEKKTRSTIDGYFEKQFQEKAYGVIKLKKILITEEGAKPILLSNNLVECFQEYLTEYTPKVKKEKRTPKTAPIAVVDKPKPEDKRGKELSELHKTLDKKEPIKLTAVVVASAIGEEVKKRCELECGLCSQIINSNYVLVKPRIGCDLLCHEVCWKKCNLTSEEIKRLYRYDITGKCLEKLSFAPPPVTSPEPTYTVEEAVLATAELISEPVPTPKEYQPSWREVDVHDYEVLKKDVTRDDKEKQERRKAKKAAKAVKFVDLAPYHAQRERELIREGNKIWHEIFREPVKEEKTVELAPRPEKEEPFVTACCEILTPSVPKQEKEFCLSIDAPEFVPMRSAAIPPRQVLLCMTCGSQRFLLDFVRMCAVCGSFCTQIESV